jgi:hypothetical protein
MRMRARLYVGRKCAIVGHTGASVLVHSCMRENAHIQLACACANAWLRDVVYTQTNVHAWTSLYMRGMRDASVHALASVFDAHAGLRIYACLCGSGSMRAVRSLHNACVHARLHQVHTQLLACLA